MSCFQSYSNLWNLHINLDKTKLLICGDRPARNRLRFIHMCRHDIEVLDTLNVWVSRVPKTNDNVQQARKALFNLY